MKVLMIGPIEKSGGVSTHTKNLVTHLNKQGVDVIIFNTSGHIAVRIYKRTMGLLIKAIKERKKYDIIHIQASGGIFSFVSAIFGAIASKLTGKNLIITFHYSREEFYSRYKRWINFAIETSGAFINVSNRNQTLLLKYIKKTNQSKLVVIPNGYDEQTFRWVSKAAARKDLGLPHDSKIIVNIANLLPHKGQMHLIEAIKIISKSLKFNDIKCYIIGSGPMYSKLESLIEEARLSDTIKLTGWISTDQIISHLNSADLFVFPSLPGGESFGMVQIEAMGCGLPIVAAKNGASEEIVCSDEYGLLCEPANSKDLAEKILSALEKKWDCGKIWTYAMKFTWDNVTNQVINVYESLIKR
jgi:glycosyltransferase involved in cell wall biosynthesis